MGDMDAAALRDRAGAGVRELARSGDVDRVVALIDELSDQLRFDWAEALDPYLAEAMMAGLLTCQQALRSPDSASRLEGVHVGLEQVRQAARDTVDGSPADPSRPPRELLAWLDGLGATQQDLARLLGVSTRQLQRWAPDAPQLSPTVATRLRAVASVVAQLRWVLPAPNGILAWFESPNPLLTGGTSPVSLLDDPLAAPQLIAAAARLRSMVAA